MVLLSIFIINDKILHFYLSKEKIKTLIFYFTLSILIYQKEITGNIFSEKFLYTPESCICNGLPTLKHRAPVVRVAILCFTMKTTSAWIQCSCCRTIYAICIQDVLEVCRTLRPPITLIWPLSAVVTTSENHSQPARK